MDIYCVFYFILLVNLFYTNCFSFFLTVLFNNLTTFFFIETLSLAWLKITNKIFVLYLGKVSLIKHIWYNNTQMKCGEKTHLSNILTFTAYNVFFVQNSI